MTTDQYMYWSVMPQNVNNNSPYYKYTTRYTWTGMTIEDWYQANFHCHDHWNPFILEKRGFINLGVTDARMKTIRYYKSIVKKYNNVLEPIY